MLDHAGAQMLSIQAGSSESSLRNRANEAERCDATGSKHLTRITSQFDQLDQKHDKKA